MISKNETHKASDNLTSSFKGGVSSSCYNAIVMAGTIARILSIGWEFISSLTTLRNGKCGLDWEEESEKIHRRRGLGNSQIKRSAVADLVV